MSIVRFVSSSVSAILLVLCIAVGAWAFPASTAVGFALLTFIVAFTVSMARAAGAPSRRSVAISAGFGACASIVVFALLGFCAIAGPASGPIMWAALVAAAIVFWSPRGRRRMPAPVIDLVRTGPPVGDTRAPAPPAVVAGTLTDMTAGELCRAWRHSWLVLLDTRFDPTRWVQVAEARRRYLDELERRDPIGFSRWLESGARAGGNPLRFIASHAPIDARNGDDPPERTDGPA